MLTKKELKNTYLKYSPEITEEIFNKVIERLEELGFTKYSDRDDYKLFKFGYLYLCGGYDWLINSGTCTYTGQIQLSDLIDLEDTNSLDKKELTVDDLVEGEIYAHNEWISKYIGTTDLDVKEGGSISLRGNNFYRPGRGSWGIIKDFIENIRPATPEESKWLKTCIKADKFILKDQLDKYDDEGNLIEKEFEFNKWYKEPNSKWLMFIKSKTEGYGFNTEEKWVNNEQERWSSNIYTFPQATNKEVEERLLEYAREKYPTGTVFNPVHVISDTEKCIVTNNMFKFANDNLYALTDEGNTNNNLYGCGLAVEENRSKTEKYGNTQSQRIVWSKAKGWAEIIEEKVEDMESKAKKDIPEYVELKIDSAWGVPAGTICKIIGDNSSVSSQYILESHIKSTMTSEEEYRFYYMKGHCIPSTKEAYEAQFNKNEFKKGDYIVFTEAEYPDDKYFPINYIFKQRVAGTYLMPELDNKGSKANGWKAFRNFNKNYQESIKSDWRYATKEEIAEYDRIGKPYDVTTLNKPKFEAGKWYCYNKHVGFYFKCSKADESRIYYSEYISIEAKKHRYSNDSYSNIYVTHKEIPLSEIQQYLPDGHPDKFTEVKPIEDSVDRVLIPSEEFKKNPFKLDNLDYNDIY